MLTTSKLIIRNNHDAAYFGPVRFTTKQSDGNYLDITGKFNVVVKDSIARGVVTVPACNALDLMTNPTTNKTLSPSNAHLAVESQTGYLKLFWDNHPIATLDFSLVVSKEDIPFKLACSQMQPLQLQFTPDDNGQLHAQAEQGPFRLNFVVEVYAEGFLDLAVTIERIAPSHGEKKMLLLRRIKTAPVANRRMCWNGRRFEEFNEPDHYEYDFRYSHNLDWLAWNSGDSTFFAVNNFTPYHLIKKGDRWTAFTNRHYFIPEHVQCIDNSIYLISNIAYGVDPDKDAVLELPLYQGDPRTICWRLAVNPPDDEAWRTSQHYTYAGYRLAREKKNETIYDLGAHEVRFGTSYFPYSTFVENFDYFRVKGDDREGWWPFSPTMWLEWEKFKPAMKRDIRIMKALGFSYLRPHYVGHLRTMERDRTVAFLDWFFGQARHLGLKVLIDSEGDPEWIAMLVRRYGDIIYRFELENEVLLSGIRDNDTPRWQSQYQAIKAIKTDLPVHLTADGKMAVFEKARLLGVPYDAVGYHTYRHNPGRLDVELIAALSGAAYASGNNLECLLTEFNWKGFTRLSPADRSEMYREVFTNMLAPRAFGEFFQFHLQETLAPNPILARSGIRHYEILYLDRRLKPEGFILHELMRRYAPPDDAWQKLRIEPVSAAMINTTGKAVFKLTNTTVSLLQAKLTAESYDGLTVKITGSDHIMLGPGSSTQIPVSLALDEAAPPGVYHFFLRCDLGREQVMGWGWTAKGGTPPFEPKPVLTTFVDYPQGPEVVKTFDYTRPTCITFGADKVSMEMAYIVFNTLREVTGYEFHLTNLDTIPDAIKENGNLILVGPPKDNALIAGLNLTFDDTKGLIQLVEQADERQWLVLSGSNKEAVTAAAMDFVLRYWQNARNAAINKVGAEPGRALGDQKDLGLLNPP
ncbi:MAG: hypothetical protein JW709_04040 [Sedimentisphaerales bacterium]|nr:hypothetical protein [Sedimentisphaerales bacterium]